MDPGDRTPPQSPHPLRLMYPSTERRGATGAGIRDAVRSRPRLSLRQEGNEGKRRDYFFGLITFPSLLLLFPPSSSSPPHHFFFFAFCHIMRLGADDVTSVGTVGPTHVLPGARDAGREGRLIALPTRDGF